MKTADLLSDIRSLRVFAAGNAPPSTIQNTPVICQGLAVAEYVIEFVPPLHPDLPDERSATSDQSLISKLEARFGSSDVILLYDEADEKTTSFTPAVRESLSNLIARYRGKTVWICTPRPELFQDAVFELSPQAAEAAALRLPGRPEPRQLFQLSHARLLMISGGPVELVVVQSNREDRVPLRGWSREGAVAFTVGAACALNVSGSPLLAARFGTLAAVAQDSTGSVSETAISAAAAQFRS